MIVEALEKKQNQTRRKQTFVNTSYAKPPLKAYPHYSEVAAHRPSSLSLSACSGPSIRPGRSGRPG